MKKLIHAALTKLIKNCQYQWSGEGKNELTCHGIKFEYFRKKNIEAEDNEKGAAQGRRPQDTKGAKDTKAERERRKKVFQKSSKDFNPDSNGGDN